MEVFLSVFQWNLRTPLRHLTSRLHWARWKYKLIWFYCHSRMSEKSKVKKSVLYWRGYGFMATALSHEWLLQFQCCLHENFALFTYLPAIMHQSMVLTLPKWAVFLQKRQFGVCFLAPGGLKQQEREMLSALLEMFKLSQGKEQGVGVRPISPGSWGTFFGCSPITQSSFSHL